MPLKVPTVESGLERSIQAAIARVRTQRIDVSVSSDGVNKLLRPLGRITGQADEFQKSLEASNARIIAFGAGVAVINGVTNAFDALLESTIRVQKTLADIGVVLDSSQGSIADFGAGIFEVARDTGQAFDDVAEGALEFARQGLDVEESLSRVSDALILTRLTGIDATAAVEGLTAAVNNFGEAGLTTTDIINRLAAVDVDFAVSSQDLIEGLKRASATATGAKVPFDELVATITVLQERTARGGAVIGNALKTIFARLQTTSTLSALKDVGVEVQDLAGNINPSIQLLKDLKVQLEDVGDVQSASVLEKVAGKRQLDILLNLLEALGDEEGRFAEAISTSANATDEAIRKNEQLNQTLAALINTSKVSLTELGAALGELGLTDNLEGLIGGFNTFVEGIRGLLDEDEGSNLAKGLVKGIGNVLIKVGLPLFAAVLAKISLNFLAFGKNSLKALLGINSELKEQEVLQDSILSSLLQNEDVLKEILKFEDNREAQARILLAVYEDQAEALEKVQKIAQGVTSDVRQAGFSGGPAGITKTSARGYIPTAAGGFEPAMASESAQISRGVGGAPKTAKPVPISNFNFGGGQRGTIVANTSEFIIRDFAGKGKGDAIFNKQMIQKFGIPSGGQKITAATGGFVVPNFAEPSKLFIVSGTKNLLGKIADNKKAFSLGVDGSYEAIKLLFPEEEFGKRGDDKSERQRAIRFLTDTTEGQRVTAERENKGVEKFNKEASAPGGKQILKNVQASRALGTAREKKIGEEDVKQNVYGLIYPSLNKGVGKDVDSAKNEADFLKSERAFKKGGKTIKEEDPFTIFAQPVTPDLSGSTFNSLYDELEKGVVDVGTSFAKSVNAAAGGGSELDPKIVEKVLLDRLNVGSVEGIFGSLFEGAVASSLGVEGLGEGKEGARLDLTAEQSSALFEKLGDKNSKRILQSKNVKGSDVKNALSPKKIEEVAIKARDTEKKLAIAGGFIPSLATGFVPNFTTFETEKSLPNIRSPLFDWDGTIIPNIGGNTEAYKAGLKSLTEEDLLPIGERLAASRKKFDIATARTDKVKPDIRETALRLKLPVRNITTLGSSYEDEKVIGKKGKPRGLRSFEKKVRFAQDTGRKIIDDDEENLKLLGRFGVNANVMNQKLSGDKTAAAGFVPNFVGSIPVNVKGLEKGVGNAASRTEPLRFQVIRSYFEGGKPEVLKQFSDYQEANNYAAAQGDSREYQTYVVNSKNRLFDRNFSKTKTAASGYVPNFQDQFSKFFIHFTSPEDADQILKTKKILKSTVVDGVFAVPEGGVNVKGVQRTKLGRAANRNAAVRFIPKVAPDVVFPEEAIFRPKPPENFIRIRNAQKIAASSAETLLSGGADIKEEGQRGTIRIKTKGVENLTAADGFVPNFALPDDIAALIGSGRKSQTFPANAGLSNKSVKVSELLKKKWDLDVLGTKAGANITISPEGKEDSIKLNYISGDPEIKGLGNQLYKLVGSTAAGLGIKTITGNITRPLEGEEGRIRQVDKQIESRKRIGPTEEVTTPTSIGVVTRLGKNVKSFKKEFAADGFVPNFVFGKTDVEEDFLGIQKIRAINTAKKGDPKSGPFVGLARGRDGTKVRTDEGRAFELEGKLYGVSHRVDRFNRSNISFGVLPGSKPLDLRRRDERVETGVGALKTLKKVVQEVKLIPNIQKYIAVTGSDFKRTSLYSKLLERAGVPFDFDFETEALDIEDIDDFETTSGINVGKFNKDSLKGLNSTQRKGLSGFGEFAEIILDRDKLFKVAADGYVPNFVDPRKADPTQLRSAAKNVLDSAAAKISIRSDIPRPQALTIADGLSSGDAEIRSNNYYEAQDLYDGYPPQIQAIIDEVIEGMDMVPAEVKQLANLNNQINVLPLKKQGVAGRGIKGSTRFEARAKREKLLKRSPELAKAPFFAADGYVPNFQDTGVVTLSRVSREGGFKKKNPLAARESTKDRPIGLGLVRRIQNVRSDGDLTNILKLHQQKSQKALTPTSLGAVEKDKVFAERSGGRFRQSSQRFKTSNIIEKPRFNTLRDPKGEELIRLTLGSGAIGFDVNSFVGTDSKNIDRFENEVALLNARTVKQSLGGEEIKKIERVRASKLFSDKPRDKSGFVKDPFSKSVQTVQPRASGFVPNFADVSLVIKAIKDFKQKGVLPIDIDELQRLNKNFKNLSQEDNLAIDTFYDEVDVQSFRDALFSLNLPSTPPKEIRLASEVKSRTAALPSDKEFVSKSTRRVKSALSDKGPFALFKRTSKDEILKDLESSRVLDELDEDKITLFRGFNTRNIPEGKERVGRVFAGRRLSNSKKRELDSITAAQFLRSRTYPPIVDILEATQSDTLAGFTPTSVSRSVARTFSTDDESTAAIRFPTANVINGQRLKSTPEPVGPQILAFAAQKGAVAFDLNSILPESSLSGEEELTLLKRSSIPPQILEKARLEVLKDPFVSKKPQSKLKSRDIITNNRNRAFQEILADQLPKKSGLFKSPKKLDAAKGFVPNFFGEDDIRNLEVEIEKSGGKRVGEGQSGAVFRVDDKAVKIPNPLGDSQEERDRLSSAFIKEGVATKILERVGIPVAKTLNVPSVKTPFLVKEFVGGRPFSKVSGKNVKQIRDQASQILIKKLRKYDLVIPDAESRATDNIAFTTEGEKYIENTKEKSPAKIAESIVKKRMVKILDPEQLQLIKKGGEGEKIVKQVLKERNLYKNSDITNSFNLGKPESFAADGFVPNFQDGIQKTILGPAFDRKPVQSTSRVSPERIRPEVILGPTFDSASVKTKEKTYKVVIPPEVQTRLEEASKKSGRKKIADRVRNALANAAIKGVSLVNNVNVARALEFIGDDVVRVGQQLIGAQGYIPNFQDGIKEAIKRENAAGIPIGQIRVGQDKRLIRPSNPLGFGVTNTRDEPRGLRDVSNRRIATEVPNFALDLPPEPSASTASTKEFAEATKDASKKTEVFEKVIKDVTVLLKKNNKLEKEAIEKFIKSLRGASDELGDIDFSDGERSFEAFREQLEKSGTKLGPAEKSATKKALQDAGVQEKEKGGLGGVGGIIAVQTATQIASGLLSAIGGPVGKISEAAVSGIGNFATAAFARKELASAGQGLIDSQAGKSGRAAGLARGVGGVVKKAGTVGLVVTAAAEVAKLGKAFTEVFTKSEEKNTAAVEKLTKAIEGLDIGALSPEETKRSIEEQEKLFRNIDAALVRSSGGNIRAGAEIVNAEGILGAFTGFFSKTGAAISGFGGAKIGDREQFQAIAKQFFQVSPNASAEDLFKIVREVTSESGFDPGDIKVISELGRRVAALATSADAERKEFRELLVRNPDVFRFSGSSDKRGVERDPASGRANLNIDENFFKDAEQANKILSEFRDLLEEEYDIKLNIGDLRNKAREIVTQGEKITQFIQTVNIEAAKIRIDNFARSIEQGFEVNEKPLRDSLDLLKQFTSFNPTINREIEKRVALADLEKQKRNEILQLVKQEAFEGVKSVKGIDVVNEEDVKAVEGLLSNLKANIKLGVDSEELKKFIKEDLNNIFDEQQFLLKGADVTKKLQETLEGRLQELRTGALIAEQEKDKSQILDLINRGIQNTLSLRNSEYELSRLSLEAEKERFRVEEENRKARLQESGRLTTNVLSKDIIERQGLELDKSRPQREATLDVGLINLKFDKELEDIDFKEKLDAKVFGVLDEFSEKITGLSGQVEATSKAYKILLEALSIIPESGVNIQTTTLEEKASGGLITSGSGTKDDVPSLLMKGEYVIRKDAVKKYGAGFFEDLNQGRVPGFQAGGLVGSNDGAKVTFRNEGSGAPVVIIKNEDGKENFVFLFKKLEEVLRLRTDEQQRLIDRNLSLAGTGIQDTGAADFFRGPFIGNKDQFIDSLLFIQNISEILDEPINDFGELKEALEKIDPSLAVKALGQIKSEVDRLRSRSSLDVLNEDKVAAVEFLSAPEEKQPGENTFLRPFDFGLRSQGGKGPLITTQERLEQEGFDQLLVEIRELIKTLKDGEEGILTTDKEARNKQREAIEDRRGLEQKKAEAASKKFVSTITTLEAKLLSLASATDRAINAFFDFSEQLPQQTFLRDFGGTAAKRVEAGVRASRLERFGGSEFALRDLQLEILDQARDRVGPDPDVEGLSDEEAGKVKREYVETINKEFRKLLENPISDFDAGNLFGEVGEGIITVRDLIREFQEELDRPLDVFEESIINVGKFKEEFGVEIPKLFKNNLTGALQDAIVGAEDLGDALKKAAISFFDEISRKNISQLVDLVFAGSQPDKQQPSSGGGGAFNFSSLAGGAFDFLKGLIGRNTGGMINSGQSGVDRVPAMLTKGEFVIRKDSVDKFGPQIFETLNKGEIPKFRSGGLVGGLRKSDLRSNDEDLLGIAVSRAQERGTAPGDFFIPGERGQGNIKGRKNLISFGLQEFTSGQSDVLASRGDSVRGGFSLASLEPESVRLSLFARQRQSPINDRIRAAKEQALGLARQEDEQRREAKRIEKELDERFKSSLITAGVTSLLRIGGRSLAAGVQASSLGGSFTKGFGAELKSSFFGKVDSALDVLNKVKSGGTLTSNELKIFKETVGDFTNGAIIERFPPNVSSAGGAIVNNIPITGSNNGVTYAAVKDTLLVGDQSGNTIQIADGVQSAIVAGERFLDYTPVGLFTRLIKSVPENIVAAYRFVKGSFLGEESDFGEGLLPPKGSNLSFNLFDAEGKNFEDKPQFRELEVPPDFLKRIETVQAQYELSRKLIEDIEEEQLRNPGRPDLSKQFRLPRQQGGLVGDTIPALLSGGEFVLNRGAVQNLGQDKVQAINAGVDPFSDVGDRIVEKLDNISPQGTAASAPIVNVTVNIEGGGANVSTQQEEQGGTPQTQEGGRQLASQIKDAVIGILLEEQRLGGVLRR